VTKQVFALPCIAFLAASLAGAQGQVPNKVGVIQIQSALASTKDGQKAIQDLQTRLGPKDKEMEKKRVEIQGLQDTLNKGGNAMAETARAELTRNIELKTKVFNRDLEDMRAEAEQEQRKIIEELSAKMTPVIDRYAQANGYSIIMDVSNPNTPVLYASTAVDITKDIIDLYDKSTPTVPGAKPTTTTPPAAKPTTPAATKPAPPPAVAPAKKQ
jgi:outer membrane protein